MAQDWKDLLASMAGQLPEGTDAPETAECDTVAAPAPQTLRVVIDRKGRKGKVATIIEGFTIPDAEVEALASELKRRIGTGGSSRGGEILLQGDWKEKTVSLLKLKGFNVKN